MFYLQYDTLTNHCILLLFYFYLTDLGEMMLLKPR